jgi:hypothetical protein
MPMDIALVELEQPSAPVNNPPPPKPKPKVHCVYFTTKLLLVLLFTQEVKKFVLVQKTVSYLSCITAKSFPPIIIQVQHI